MTVTISPIVTGAAAATAKPATSESRKNMSRNDYFAEVVVPLTKATVEVRRERNDRFRNGRRNGKLEVARVPIFKITGANVRTFSLHICPRTVQLHGFDTVPPDHVVTEADGSRWVVYQGSDPSALIDVFYELYLNRP